MRLSDEMLARAEDTLKELMGRLAPDSLNHLIYEPIQRAAQTFEWPPAPSAAREVLPIAASFLQHLQREAHLQAGPLSLMRAQDEVVDLLEADSGQRATGGYIGAVLETLEPPAAGWGGVALRIATAFQSRLHQRYVRWAIESAIAPSDWALRCAMTAVLIRWLEPLLPADIAAGPPERWAGHLATLLATYMGAGPGVRLSGADLG